MKSQLLFSKAQICLWNDFLEPLHPLSQFVKLQRFFLRLEYEIWLAKLTTKNFLRPPNEIFRERSILKLFKFS